MATYKPVLHHRKKQDGTKRVMIRITKDRKVVYIATEIYLQEKDWNTKKGEVKTSHRLFEVYNSAIWKQVSSIQDSEVRAQLEGAPKSSKEIKKLSTRTKVDFIHYYTAQLEIIKATRSETTWQRYHYSLLKLKKYTGDNLSFPDIDLNWVENYYVHLLTFNNANTANKEMETISSLLSKAINEGFIVNYISPFFNFKPKKAIVIKDRLTMEEIEKLENKQLEGPKALYRDLFLLQYYAAGMRISDALTIQIKFLRGDRLEYTMHKTGKQRSLLVSGKMETIINRYRQDKGPEEYLFPILKANPATRKQIEVKTSQINTALKNIAKAVEINKRITTHTARHSFADIARLKTKDIYSISKALGHSDIKITQAYLSSLDMGENDEFITSITG